MDPLNPILYVWTGLQCGMVGRWEDAAAEARKALELNPEFPDGLLLLGDAYAEKGSYSQAIAFQEKAAAIDPVFGRYTLGRTHARAGRKDDARRIASDLRKNPKQWDKYGLTIIYAALGEKDEAFRRLEAMYADRHMYTPWIRVMPEFSPLRGDSRFDDMVRRPRLPVQSSATE